MMEFLVALIADLEARLRAHADPRRAAGEKRYLKSDLTFYGTDLPTMRQLVRDTLRARPV